MKNILSEHGQGLERTQKEARVSRKHLNSAKVGSRFEAAPRRPLTISPVNVFLQEKHVHQHPGHQSEARFTFKFTSADHLIAAGCDIFRQASCNVMATASTENHLCTKFNRMAIEARSLMHLPVEVRLIIYRHLFSNSENIKLDVNKQGYIAFTSTAKLHLPSLRTCKTFYIEGCPVLYGINTFAITFKDVQRLARMRQGSRLCIENLTVETVQRTEPEHRRQRATVQPLALHGLVTGMLASRQPRPPPVEILDLGTIGTTLCGLQNLVVNPSTASTFLVTVLQLSKNLPCSPIRTWPVLEVVVNIQTQPAEYIASDHILSLTDEHKKLISTSRRLSSLSQTSTLGLGHEMPDLKTIRVNGDLTWDLCQLIESHKSSFGDCSFEKQIIRNSMAEDHKDSKYKYTWRRIDEDEQQAKARNAAVDMHQWVPRLTREDYLKVLASCEAEPEAVQYPLPRS
jgi:hypothetical protein